MIYLDTSILLAELLAEDRRADPVIWLEPLVSSRLLEYEVWTRLNRLDVAPSRADAAREMLQRVSLLEMTPHVLARALDPFPEPLRTLDALHLASFEFLRDRGGARLKLATFDERLARVARRMGIPLQEGATPGQ